MPNHFLYITRYQMVGVAKVSRTRSITIEARDIPLSKSGLQAYSLMQFTSIVPEISVLCPEPKWCGHAVLAPFQNDHSLGHPNPNIEP